MSQVIRYLSKRYGRVSGQTTDDEIEDCVRTMEHDMEDAPSEGFSDEVAEDSIRAALADFVAVDPD